MNSRKDPMNELVVMNSLSDRISTHFEGVEEKKRGDGVCIYS